jgi:proteasome beta subunit
MDDELKNSILKSGTTIIGIVCKDGVVMASDRQSTAGTIVMNKNSEKTKKIGDNFLYSGTGMVSDIQRTAKILEAELRLKELRSKKRPTVKQAASLLAMMVYSNIRRPSMIPSMVGTLLGGVNEDGEAELYTVEPAGSVVKVEEYDANFGSGMPYVLGLLERQYKKGLTVKEGVELAKEALLSSTQRDVGSGYGIDIFTITKNGVKKVFETDMKFEIKAK